MRKIPIAWILQKKGSHVHTIRADRSVHEAILMLVGLRVGSLVVTANDAVVGILTERDVLIENARRFDRIAETRVDQIMTRRVVFGSPEQTLDDVMHTMTEKRIRHLPILKDGELAGLISIGDVVKVQMEEATHQIEHLSNYIASRYPA
ncbi:MAG: CBS domain-containing protein [Planctomycetes bacterium]|nr:CBS domain-containing protein [Planctomycetota bacterium]